MVIQNAPPQKAAPDRAELTEAFALAVQHGERIETVAAESKIKLASRLYGMRETAKELLGADYLERMAEFGAILSETAAREKKDVIQVAVEVCKQPGCGPLETITVMAAAVELVEPTYARTPPQRLEDEE